MAHHFQRQRAANIKEVKRLIALCMKAGGALDTELRAKLSKTIARRTVNDYLTSLSESGEISFDEKTKRWVIT